MTTTEKLTPQQFEAGLSDFYGSENFHRLAFFCRWLIATDGVKYVCEKAGGGAFWLMDAIASHQPACKKDPKGMLQEMQFWTLKVNLEDKTAVLTCDRDEGDTAITQHIPYTDFPIAEIKIWVEGVWGERMTAMLPSER